MAQNTTVVTVRVTNDVAAWFKKDNNARKILTSLYNLVKSGKIYCSGEELVISRLNRDTGVGQLAGIDKDKRYAEMEKRYYIERETRREVSKRLEALEDEWRHVLGDVTLGTLKTLEDFAIANKTTISRIVTDLCAGIIRGVIEIDENGIKTKEVFRSQLDTSSFVDACDAMNKDYDYTMASVVKKIYEGEI